MAINVGQRLVADYTSGRSSTANTAAQDMQYGTPSISEGGYSWSTPEATVDTAGKYLYVGDIGQVQLSGATRAVGSHMPHINGVNQIPLGMGSHRYLRNSGGTMGASIGMAILDLAASDVVKVRNPGNLSSTHFIDSVSNYATNATYGGALQLIRLPDNDMLHLERDNTNSADPGISNINTTRPWIDASGTWGKLTWSNEVQDDGAWAADLNGDVTLPANKKFLIVWSASHYSTDASRHAYVTALNIAGQRVQTASGYQRTTASQGPPHGGMYLHETGGSAETLFLEATQESEGADAGTPQFRNGALQVIELPSSAEWIHADNSTTDSLTTALAGTTTWYDTPLSSSLRADGDSNLSLDSANDAIQNDSGGALPVLAIGWHRWDRDSGVSGVRKMPWTRWDNGGSALGYGVAGAFSRGQQSGDDTFQAHYVSPVTLDLADGADLKFQVNEPASGSNADMGIYASASRYFLGVQVLNLNSLDAGSSAQDLTLPAIASTETMYTPTVATGAVTLTLPHEVDADSLYAMTVELGGIPAQDLTLPHISNSNTLYQPTIAPGSVNLTLPLIGSTSTLNPMTVSVGAVGLTLPLISNTNTLYPISLTMGAITLTLPVISNTSTLYGMSLAVGAVDLTLPLISSTSVLHSMTITTGVTVQLPDISSTNNLYAMTLDVGAIGLTLPAITNTSTLYPPSLGVEASELTLPLIGSTETLYPPVVMTGGVGLALSFISDGETFYGMTITTGAVGATLPHITNVGTLYPMSAEVETNIELPLITQSNTLFAPVVAAGAVSLTVPHIADPDTLYPFSVEQIQRLTLPIIATTTVLYGMTVEVDPYLVLPRIENAPQLFDFTSNYNVTLPQIDTTQIYPPEVNPFDNVTLPYIVERSNVYPMSMVALPPTLTLPLIEETVIYPLHLVRPTALQYTGASWKQM